MSQPPQRPPLRQPLRRLCRRDSHWYDPPRRDLAARACRWQKVARNRPVTLAGRFPRAQRTRVHPTARRTDAVLPRPVRREAPHSANLKGSSPSRLGGGVALRHGACHCAVYRARGRPPRAALRIRAVGRSVRGRGRGRDVTGMNRPVRAPRTRLRTHTHAHARLHPYARARKQRSNVVLAGRFDARRGRL